LWEKIWNSRRENAGTSKIKRKKGERKREKGK
jgi:hypothetical protein